MDTAMIVDGVVVQVWRDSNIALARATGAGVDDDLQEFPPATAFCGMLWDGETLSAPPPSDRPEPRRLVAKSTIVRRLHEAGLLGAALAVLDDPDNLYARERWRAPDWPNVYADDDELLSVLANIGADIATITAV